MESTTIKIEHCLPIHLQDAKINCKSWLVVMSIRDYLAMLPKDGEAVESQRSVQKSKIYDSLKSDLLNDAIMPPMSVVYLKDIDIEKKELEIGQFRVLDGLQRTNCIKECINTLKEIEIGSQSLFPTEHNAKIKHKIKKTDDFLNKFVYIEIWENPAPQAILYKMIVLNTGQKKMDYEHQLDIMNLVVKEKLVNKGISIYTRKEKEEKKPKPAGAFELSDITEGLASFINRKPTSSAKNAAEFLLERFVYSIDIDANEKTLNIINEEEPYQLLTWVLTNFNNILVEKYKERNPLQTYPLFLVSLLAAMGDMYAKEDQRERLLKKIEFINMKFPEREDPIQIDVFNNIYNSFTTGIGKKRRDFIFESFRGFFLLEHITEIEWLNNY